MKLSLLNASLALWYASKASHHVSDGCMSAWISTFSYFSVQILLTYGNSVSADTPWHHSPIYFKSQQFSFCSLSWGTPNKYHLHWERLQCWGGMWTMLSVHKARDSIYRTWNLYCLVNFQIICSVKSVLGFTTHFPKGIWVILHDAYKCILSTVKY